MRDDDIRRLRQESQFIGDVPMVIICDIALGARRAGGAAVYGANPYQRKAAEAAVRMSLAEARAECERVIKAGAA